MRPTLPAKVLVVIEENHSLLQMRTGMPFLWSQAQRYGYATHWNALAHPSEPNYLAIAGGSMFEVTDDRPPGANAPKVGDATSVFGQALTAGKSARTYAESMPAPCADHDTASYAVRHNPWVYFGREVAACRQGDLDTTTFTTDATENRLPNVGFLIPNLDNDAHDGSLATADGWLSRELSPVLGSQDFARGRLVVVVTADEDDKHSGNVVLTSVLTPRLAHKVVDAPMTHYSLTRFIATVLGRRPLGQGASAPGMRAAFGL